MAEPLGEDALADLMDTIGSVVGEGVRQYRLALGMTIVDLAEATGLSKAMLSKIENNKTSPSLATLARLSQALDVPVTAFFGGLEVEEHDFLLVKSGAGMEIGEANPRSGVSQHRLGMLRGSHRRLEPTIVTFDESQDEFPEFSHAGSELIYVLYGSFEYRFGDNRYVIEAGDAIQFNGAVPHGVTQILQFPAQFLSIKAYGVVPETPERDNED